MFLILERTQNHGGTWQFNKENCRIPGARFANSWDQLLHRNHWLVEDKKNSTQYILHTFSTHWRFCLQKHFCALSHRLCFYLGRARKSLFKSLGCLCSSWLHRLAKIHQDCSIFFQNTQNRFLRLKFPIFFSKANAFAKTNALLKNSPPWKDDQKNRSEMKLCGGPGGT